MFLNLSELENKLRREKYYDEYGTISSVSGLKIISNGPDVSKGDICVIKCIDEDVMCEVIGFSGNEKYLMPIDRIDAIKAKDKVYKSSRSLKLTISEDYLGCVLDGLGNVIKDNGIYQKRKVQTSIQNKAPSPFERGFVSDSIATGIKAIDGLNTIGKGQRIGIFSGSGVGKTTLITDILKNNSSDINVIALIGERGREVNEFLKALGDKIDKSIIVTATSDESPLVRMKCAFTATAVAEYFRDQGKDVLLVMDSLTRLAYAQRDIGTNTGELPLGKGFTPSLFEMLPKLLERAGKNEKGSITGLYTVLVEGDDENEIISDTIRGILDGHIVLSRKLAQRNHFPAIDIGKSISRLMNDIVSKEHMTAAGNLRSILSYYQENEDYLNMFYTRGTDAKMDKLLNYHEIINKYVKQSAESFSFQESVDFLIVNFLKIDIDV